MIVRLFWLVLCIFWGGLFTIPSMYMLNEWRLMTDEWKAVFLIAIFACSMHVGAAFRVAIYKVLRKSITLKELERAEFDKVGYETYRTKRRELGTIDIHPANQRTERLRQLADQVVNGVPTISPLWYAEVALWAADQIDKQHGDMRGQTHD